MHRGPKGEKPPADVIGHKTSGGGTVYELILSAIVSVPVTVIGVVAFRRLRDAGALPPEKLELL
jgi:hypothetical protein